MRGCDIPIEAGVPLPRWTRGDVRDLLARMAPGDSVLVEAPQRHVILTEGRRRGYQLKSRKEHGAGVRVWLLARPAGQVDVRPVDDMEAGLSDGDFLRLRCCLNCRRRDRLSLRRWRQRWHIACDCGTVSAAEKLLSSAVIGWQGGPHWTASGALLIEQSDGSITKVF